MTNRLPNNSPSASPHDICERCGYADELHPWVIREDTYGRETEGPVCPEVDE